ncbi:MAG TPA: hypothetical protein VHZ51_06715 [Ktedonobacteraceae bacterium]|jgi:hypothetical protein|nr:hypothetical protein [Ktedonobacteraceae bacterium]
MLDYNAAATSLIGPLLIILLVVWIAFELSHGKWKCPHPHCSFETWSEVEALGHQADHARHKPVQEP